MALAIPRPRTGPPLRFLLAGLAAAVAVGGSYVAFFGNPLTNSQKTLTYPTSPVSTGTLQVTVAATGPVTNGSSVPLTFKSTGKLAEVDVTVGQQVKAGDVLARLDTSDLQTALDQDQLAVQNAQKVLDDANVSLAATQNAINQSNQSDAVSLQNAQDTLTNAQVSLAATEQQIAATVQADQVAVRNAQSNLSTAQNALANAENVAAASNTVASRQASAAQ